MEVAQDTVAHCSVAGKPQAAAAAGVRLKNTLTPVCNKFRGIERKEKKEPENYEWPKIASEIG